MTNKDTDVFHYENKSPLSNSLKTQTKHFSNGKNYTTIVHIYRKSKEQQYNQNNFTFVFIVQAGKEASFHHVLIRGLLLSSKY